ncbi:MAG: hypothetical protein NG747_05730 [Candidatus Brocadia sp.]|nr:hypothetical protein [Candidatus Brocadia sp.]
MHKAVVVSLRRRIRKSGQIRGEKGQRFATKFKKNKAIEKTIAMRKRFEQQRKPGSTSIAKATISESGGK